MMSLKDRLRISLSLSPAILLLQVWTLANANGYFIQNIGIVKSLALAISSSLLIAYIIVSTFCYGLDIWIKNYK